LTDDNMLTTDREQAKSLKGVFRPKRRIALPAPRP
jgi:hypothetical protein